MPVTWWVVVLPACFKSRLTVLPALTATSGLRLVSLSPAVSRAARTFQAAAARLAFPARARSTSWSRTGSRNDRHQAAGSAGLADGLPAKASAEATDSVPAETAAEAADSVPAETAAEAADSVPAETAAEVAGGVPAETAAEAATGVPAAPPVALQPPGSGTRGAA